MADVLGDDLHFVSSKQSHRQFALNSGFDDSRQISQSTFEEIKLKADLQHEAGDYRIASRTNAEVGHDCDRLMEICQPENEPRQLIRYVNFNGQFFVLVEVREYERAHRCQFEETRVRYRDNPKGDPQENYYYPGYDPIVVLCDIRSYCIQDFSSGCNSDKI